MRKCKQTLEPTVLPLIDGISISQDGSNSINHLWTSLGSNTCTEYLPERCNSLPHVCRLIDEYLVDSIHPQILQDACEYGASSDDLEFILMRTAPKWEDVVNAAARGGYIHVFEWMLERKDSRCPWGYDFKDVFEPAAANGHLELIKWLYSRSIGIFNTLVFDRAVSNGHLLVVQWLHKHINRVKPVRLSGYNCILSYAAGNGHLEVVQWLHENVKIENTVPAMTSAAKSGHLEILQWLHQRGICRDVCTIDVMDAAVNGGHFDVVKWLFENCKIGCSENAARYAAYNGDMPMLQWLHRHFSEKFQLDVMDHAAKGRHLDVLMWLHKHHGKACTSRAMDLSARNGRLDIVQWLHENRNEGCTTNAMKWAAEQGHLHVVKWLHQNKSEGCGDLLMYWPVLDGHLELVKWLVEHKPNICGEGLMQVAAWEGHLDMVCYLDENTRQRGSELGLSAAAKEGFIKVLSVLRHNKTFGRETDWQGSRKWSKMLFRHLSNQSATPASPLWHESLKLLELFHSDGYYRSLSTVLDEALQRGYVVMVRQFFERRSKQEKVAYVAAAAERNEIVLIRWLLENGVPLSLHSALTLASVSYTLKYVEITWWLSEDDRAALVCDALQKNWRGLLLWMLESTVFEEDSSHYAIRRALEMVDNAAEHWLSENLSNADARSWCFPSEQKKEPSAGTKFTNGATAKRRCFERALCE